ncbi:MAG: DNA-binding response regulator, partial [Phycisphaeraceae bacterium]|nr:DNA-binding response regulator [Phycisphaeraceae bacterium]
MQTLLIIEDDPAILLGLKKNLAYEGYRVLT